MTAVDDRPQAQDHARMLPETFESLRSVAESRGRGAPPGILRRRLGVKAVPDGLHTAMTMWLVQQCMQRKPEWIVHVGQRLKVETYRNGRAIPDGVLAPIGHFVGAGEWAERTVADGGRGRRRSTATRRSADPYRQAARISPRPASPCSCSSTVTSARSSFTASEERHLPMALHRRLRGSRHPPRPRRHRAGHHPTPHLGEGPEGLTPAPRRLSARTPASNGSRAARAFLIFRACPRSSCSVQTTPPRCSPSSGRTGATLAATIPDRGNDFFARFDQRMRRCSPNRTTGSATSMSSSATRARCWDGSDLMDVEEGSAELGYRIAERAAGAGLATWAVGELCGIAARQLRAERAAGGDHARQRGVAAVLARTGSPCRRGAGSSPGGRADVHPQPRGVHQAARRGGSRLGTATRAP